MANHKKHKRIMQGRTLAAAMTASAVKLSTIQSLAAGDFEVDVEKGIISNVSIITRGPAIGHGFDVDDIMLAQVAAAINSHAKGVKSRLTHPENTWDTDPIEVMLGRVRTARVDGDRVRGDMHFGSYSADSPSGDLRKYLLGIAAEDPEVIGLSIVFIPDDYEQRTDENNQSLPPAGRVKDVLAVDFVGDPGANPGGLLSSTNSGESAERDLAESGSALGETSTQGGEGTSLELLKESIMNKKQRAYLESIGLKADATLEEALIAAGKLQGDQKGAYEALQEGKKTEPAAKTAADPTAVTATGDDDKAQTLAKQAAQEALAADRTRREAIKALGTEYKMDEKFIAGLCDRGVSLENARVMIEEGAKSQLLKTGSRVRVGDDLNRSSLSDAVTDALLVKAGVRLIEMDQRTGRAALSADGKVKVREPHERSRKFSGLRIIDIGKIYLRELGVPEVDYLGHNRIADLVLDPRRLEREFAVVGLAQSSSDFPYILGNTLRKSLRTAYAETPSTWQLWCGRNVTPDYKQFRLLILSEIPDLESVPEGGPVPYSTLTEGHEAATLVKYLRGIRITREAIINDDLNAFGRLPQSMGQAAKRKEDELAYAILTANAVLDNDSVALFDSSTHANYVASSGAAPSVATLGAAEASLGTKKGIGSAAYLDLEPKFLIVPKALAVTARQLVGAMYDPAKSGPINNPYYNQLTVVSSGRLDANSTAKWYVSADPARIDTVILTFLEEEQTPVVEQETDFDSECIKYKVRHSAVAKAADYRGLYCNCGS